MTIKELRREQILSAATKIFSEKTYHGASLKDIGDAVGLRKSSLYHYISSKEKLLVEIVLGALRAMDKGLAQVENTDLTPVERLRQIIREHVKFQVEYREAGSLFISERHIISSLALAEVSEIFERRDRLLARTLKEGAEMGLYRPVDIRIVSLAILGACNSVLLWHRPSGRLSYEEIADRFFDFFHRGLSVTS